ncbi:hypothetical protein MMC07_001537 [Pseudocyphellaria aurata]|nr:hypothetical protein [Pseudocyphellaria aurata]
MTTITLASLPAEVQVSIAKYCEDSDLINFCRTSKALNATCLHLLYRHVDLVRDQDFKYASSHHDDDQMLEALRRQCLFIATLQSHPEYGRFVRFLRGPLFTPNLEYATALGDFDVSDASLWRAMTSFTHVQSVEAGMRGDDACLISMQIPSVLFQSATSVTLASQMQYGLAKAILDGINPATLRNLCLDKVQDRKTEEGRYTYTPGTRAENGRVVAHGAMSGLLTTLTGRCTALQTLTLRRIGQNYADERGVHWHPAAEESSYTEWALFIRSVQGTVEKVVFEQAEMIILTGLIIGVEHHVQRFRFRTMDERFERLVLPTLVSGEWPSLTCMQLQGVRYSRCENRWACLAPKLETFYGGNTTVVVDGLAFNVEDRRVGWPSQRALLFRDDSDDEFRTQRDTIFFE